MSSSTKRGTNGVSGSSPAYLRIAASLRERIGEGEFIPGQNLPPERELCGQFGVSRMTARHALTVLEREGLVVRDVTRGTLVAEPRLELRLGSFSRELERIGRQPSAELLSARQVLPRGAVADGLGIDPRQRVVELRRLRRSDNEVVALETTFYREDLVPGFLDQDLTGSLWDVLNHEYGIRLKRSEAKLQVLPVVSVTAKDLQVREGSECLHFSRKTFDESNRCIEYAEDVYRADRVSLVIEREIES
jgi:GntR family transcriptional regulator